MNASFPNFHSHPLRLGNKIIINNVVFGRWGLYGVVGCLDKIRHREWYSRHHCRCKWGRCICWDTWHLRDVVREEARFGPGRYPLLKFAHHMYTYHGGSPE